VRRWRTVCFLMLFTGLALTLLSLSPLFLKPSPHPRLSVENVHTYGAGFSYVYGVQTTSASHLFAVELDGKYRPWVNYVIDDAFYWQRRSIGVPKSFSTFAGYDAVPPIIKGQYFITWNSSGAVLSLFGERPQHVVRNLPPVGRPVTLTENEMFLAVGDMLCDSRGCTKVKPSPGRIVYLEPLSNDSLWAITLTKDGGSSLHVLKRSPDGWTSSELSSWTTAHNTSVVPTASTSRDLDGDGRAELLFSLRSIGSGSSIVLATGSGMIYRYEVGSDIRGIEFLDKGYAVVASVNSTGSFIHLYVIDPVNGSITAVQAMEIGTSPIGISYSAEHGILLAYGTGMKGAQITAVRVQWPSILEIMLSHLFTALEPVLPWVLAKGLALMSAGLYTLRRAKMVAATLLALMFLLPAPAYSQPQATTVTKKLVDEMDRLEATLASADRYGVASFILEALPRLRPVRPETWYSMLYAERAATAFLRGRIVEGEYMLYLASKILEWSSRAERSQSLERIFKDSLRRGPYAAELLSIVNTKRLNLLSETVQKQVDRVAELVEEAEGSGIQVSFTLEYRRASPLIIVLALRIGLEALSVYHFVSIFVVEKLLQKYYALAGIELSDAEFWGLFLLDAAYYGAGPESGLSETLDTLNRLDIVRKWYRYLGSKWDRDLLFKYSIFDVKTREMLRERVLKFCSTEPAFCIGVETVGEEVYQAFVELEKRTSGLNKAEWLKLGKDAIQEISDYIDSWLKKYRNDAFKLSLHLSPMTREFQLASDMLYIITNFGPPGDLSEMKVLTAVFLHKFRLYLLGGSETFPLIPIIFTVTATENKHGCRIGHVMNYFLKGNETLVQSLDEAEVDIGVRVRFSGLDGVYVVSLEDTAKCPEGMEKDPDYDDVILHVRQVGANRYEVATAYSERMWQVTAQAGPPGSKTLLLTNDDLLLEFYQPRKRFQIEWPRLTYNLTEPLP